MSLPAFIRLTIRNIKVNVDPGTLTFLLGLPALYFFVLGLMFQGIIPGVELNGIDVSYTSFLAPGIIGMQALTAGNIGGSLLWSDRRWGMFEQLMVGPFRRADYLLGIMIVSVIFSLGGSLIMLAFAISIHASFIISIETTPYLILALVMGTIFFTSLFLIISVFAKSMQAYNTITIVLFFFLDFASTAFYPITSSTPVWLRGISEFNPLSMIVNVIRSSMLTTVTSSSIVTVLELFLLMLLFFSFSILSYRKIRVGS
jgi:ABC-2 type transport system permease protein